MKKILFVILFMIFSVCTAFAVEQAEDTVIIQGRVNPSIPNNGESLIINDVENGFAVAVRLLKSDSAVTGDAMNIKSDSWGEAFPLKSGNETVNVDMLHNSAEDSGYEDAIALIFAVAGNTEKKVTREITISSVNWQRQNENGEYIIDASSDFSLTVDGASLVETGDWYATRDGEGDDRFSFVGNGVQNTFLPVAYSTIEWKAKVPVPVAGNYQATIKVTVTDGQ